MSECFDWFMNHPALTVAMIAATVAIIAAHMAQRACARADAELSRAMRLASFAEDRASLAIRRVSSSRSSRLTAADKALSSSLCFNHSFATEACCGEYRPAANAFLTPTSLPPSSSCARNLCGGKGGVRFKRETPNVKWLAKMLDIPEQLAGFAGVLFSCC